MPYQHEAMIEARSLAGRTRNGAERDHGRVLHGTTGGAFSMSAALCGVEPGRRSSGWSSSVADEITCLRCRKIASSGLWKHIDENGPVYDDGSFSALRRLEFAVEYAWAVPSQDAVQKIKAFVAGGLVLEVGAGRGLWARFMRDVGINVRATDRFDDNDFHHHGGVQRGVFTTVEKMSTDEAVHLIAADVLFLCWPPMTIMAATALWPHFKGDRVVYIGERDGGCTGDEEFHKLLKRDWDEVAVVYIPRWPGIHDDMTFYRRKAV